MSNSTYYEEFVGLRQIYRRADKEVKNTLQDLNIHNHTNNVRTSSQNNTLVYRKSESNHLIFDQNNEHKYLIINIDDTFNCSNSEIPHNVRNG